MLNETNKLYALVYDNDTIHTDSGYFCVGDRKEIADMKRFFERDIDDTLIIKEVEFTDTKVNTEHVIVICFQDFKLAYNETENYVGADISYYEEQHADYFYRFIRPADNADYNIITSYLRVKK